MEICYPVWQAVEQLERVGDKGPHFSVGNGVTQQAIEKFGNKNP